MTATAVIKGGVIPSITGCHPGGSGQRETVVMLSAGNYSK